MSTTATVTPVSAAPFGFASFSHYISSGFSALKKALQFAEVKVLPTVQKVDEVAELPTAALAAAGTPYASEALLFERALDAAAGELLAVIHSTDAIDGQSFVTMQLPIATYNLFKQFIEDQKTALEQLGYKL